MISLEGHRIVDLSWELVSRVTRMDQTVEEGKRDVYNMPWIVEETYNEQDGTIEHLVACNEGTVGAWPVGGVSGHMGSHVQLGIGHNDNWTGLPEGMKGIWEMPVDAYYGEACVCKLDRLKGQPILPEHLSNVREGDVRGQEIKPEHLGNVEVGDIVLMTSPFTGLEQPWLSTATCDWLINDRKIKMLGIGAPGIEWQYDLKLPAPDNSPVRRALLGANVPIAHPLVNIDSLTRDRVFYVGLPLRFTKSEASFIRAIALEQE